MTVTIVSFSEVLIKFYLEKYFAPSYILNNCFHWIIVLTFQSTLHLKVEASMSEIYEELPSVLCLDSQHLLGQTSSYLNLLKTTTTIDLLFQPEQRLHHLVSYQSTEDHQHQQDLPKENI